ncbi:MAG: hypothetical protein JWP32_1339 [Schumannella sp.]|nr:hypothetical protein [Schumannella sp.]
MAQKRLLVGIAAVVALVVSVLGGAVPANATSATLSIGTIDSSRDAGTGRWEYSIPVSASNYWSTTCSDAYCHLQIVLEFANSTTAQLDTHPAVTGTGASTTYTFTGTALVAEVTHVKLNLLGTLGTATGPSEPVTDELPEATAEAVVLSHDRSALDGYLEYDVATQASYFGLPGAVCATGYCFLTLQGRDASTHAATTLQGLSGILGITDYPYTHRFTGRALVTEIDAVRLSVSGSGGTLDGDWVTVDEDYPEPGVAIQVDHIGFTSDNKLTYDITGQGSFYWMEDGVCRSYTYCYMEIMQRDEDGNESLLATNAQQQDVDEHPYPYTRRFAETTTYPYVGGIDEVAVRVRGPFGSLYSEWVQVHVVPPAETAGGGNPSEDGCQCAQADPVNTASGEFYLPATDLTLPGVGPVVGVSRTYSSLFRASSSAFGYGWSASFGPRLVIDVPGNPSHPLPPVVHIQQENGSQTTFHKDALDLYPAAPWVRATLVHDAVSGSWTFTRRKADTYVFDSTGKLTSITDRFGNTVDYSYTSGQLSSIEGSGGREVDLTWVSGRVTEVEDSAGRTVTYSYDGNGNLVEVVDAAGEDWGYSYDSLHRLTVQTFPEGGEVENVYDSASRVVSQTDPVDRQTTFSYAPAATTTTLPDGSVTVEEYDQGNVVSITTAEGTTEEATTTLTYNIGGNRTSVTDPLGNETVSTYDADGNELTTTDPLNRTTTRTFDALGDVTSVEDPLGRVTEMEYNTDGALTSLTSPGGHEQTWDLNSDGTLASHTDARNKTIVMTYDSAGRPLCTTDADDRESCVSYDARGFATTSTDAGGGETTVTYDDLGRTLTVTDPNDATTATTYDGDGNPLTVVDALANVTTMTYDDADQLVTSENPVGGVTSYTYADRGGIATVTNPNNDTTTTTYDALNRVATVTDGESRTTIYAYDLAGRLLSTTLPSAAVTSNTYDDAGQLVATTNALGKVTHYDYDAAGQLVRVTDPLDRETSTTYTDDGLVDTVTYPDSSTEVHAYNANGQETSFTNADGKESTYTYTPAGLLASKTEPGSMETSYTYDDAGWLDEVITPNGHTSSRSYDNAGHLTGINYQGTADDVTFTNDDLGRRLTMHDATGTTTYTYTDAGQIETVENGNAQTLAYEYDDAGQLLTITYPGNHDVGYTYDGAGQMASVTSWAAGTTDYTYTDDGYLHTRDDPDGVTETRTYDSQGQLTGILDATASATIADYGYAYDDAGQLVTTEMTDALHAATTQNWGYDPIGQLTTTTTPSGAYDATSAGPLTDTPNGDELTYNTAGQLENLANSGTGIDFDYSYDGNGNRSHQVEDYAAGPDHVIDYTYNEANKLTGWDDGTHDIDYAVDGDGLRQTRTANSTSTPYLWDPSADLPLLLDDGANTYIYGAGLTPIAQTDGTDTDYLYADNIGTVRAITDDTADTNAATDYDAYGARAAHTGTLDSQIGYTGAWTDPTTNVIYLRAREYDPRTAQFIQADPVVDFTRQAYSYTASSPLNATDPTGLCVGLDGTPQDRTCNYNDFYWAGLGNSISTQARIAHAGFSAGSTFGVGLLTNDDVNCYGSNPMFWVEYALGVTVSAAAVLLSGGTSLEAALATRFGSSAFQTLFRTVGPRELASIQSSGAYSLGLGSAGKYFYPTIEQAFTMASRYESLGLGPQTVTSGSIPQALLTAERMITPAGEGPAFYLEGAELLSRIVNVAIHGGP